jgi:lipoprotein-anchoring transpeptidase ErfK/SrfK
MQFRASRRGFVAGGLFLAGFHSSASAQDSRLISAIERALERIDPAHETKKSQKPTPPAADEQYFDPALLPPPESPVDFPIPRVSSKLVARQYRPQLVEFDGAELAGTLVVDPGQRFLYHVLAPGEARRYGVGVGRAGFAWAGTAHVGMKRKWPRWVPPRSMVERDAKARKWVNGQPGGPDNPLGARALYLFANGKDTLYRIHGTNEPRSIGKAVSSGCIRMLNEDVAELFEAVNIGTEVVVREAARMDEQAKASSAL